MSKIVLDDEWKQRIGEALKHQPVMVFARDLPDNLDKCSPVFGVIRERENVKKMIIAGEPESLTQRYQNEVGLKFLITDSEEILEKMPKDKGILVLFIQEATSLEHIIKMLDDVGNDTVGRGFDDFWEEAMKDPKKKAEIDAIMLPRLRNKEPSVISYAGVVPDSIETSTPIVCIMDGVEGIRRMIELKITKDINAFYKGQKGLKWIITDKKELLSIDDEAMKEKIIFFDNNMTEDELKNKMGIL